MLDRQFTTHTPIKMSANIERTIEMQRSLHRRKKTEKYKYIICKVLDISHVKKNYIQNQRKELPVMSKSK